MSSQLSNRTANQLTVAHHHYQAGQFAEAETLYCEILEQNPEQIAALTWLALIVDQRVDQRRVWATTIAF